MTMCLGVVVSMSEDPLSKSISDVLALQEETRKVLEKDGRLPMVEALTQLVPQRIRLSRQLLQAYLSTAENRAKLFKASESPILKMLQEPSEVTPIAVEYYLAMITDVLLRCDGTEVFDRELLESNIRDLSKYAANPNFGDGIESPSDEIPVPTVTGA